MPRDVNQLAKRLVEMTTGTAPPEPVKVADDSGKNPHAVALGRMGGLVGGKARADKLPPSVRAKIAKKAAQARWKKVKQDQGKSRTSR